MDPLRPIEGGVTMRRLLLLLSMPVLMLLALPSTAGAQGADVYGVGGGSVNFAGAVKFSKSRSPDTRDHKATSGTSA